MKKKKKIKARKKKDIRVINGVAGQKISLVEIFNGKLKPPMK